MSFTALTVFALAALLAEVLGTIGGFGSSLFFVPVAGLFFDFHSVLGITAIFHLASNLSKIVLFRKGFDKKLVLTMGLPSVIFVILGAYLTRYVQNNWLEISLGIFLLATATLFLVFRQLKINPVAANAVWGGALSGITAGMLGTGGAIRGLVLAAFNLEKEIFVSTSAFIDLGIDASRTMVYFFNGYIHRNDLYVIPVLVVVSVIGTYTGKIILSKFSPQTFKNVVLSLILAVGLIVLLKAIFPWAFRWFA